MKPLPRAMMLLGVGLVLTVCTLPAEAQPDDLLTEIRRADPTALELATLGQPSQNSIQSESRANSAAPSLSVTHSAAEAVSFDPNGADDLRVGLPYADQATEGVIRNGVMHFDNRNHSHTIPIPDSEGSVKIFTVLDSESAPEDYTYTFTSNANTSLEVDENGLVVVHTGQGDLSAKIAPAWAKDATGRPVETRYQIKNNTLTQVVAHKDHDDITYPIVADPFLGKKLFSNSGRNTYQGKPMVWLKPTKFARGIQTGSGVGGIVGLSAGRATLNQYGWAEATKLQPTLKKFKTYKQQYLCHVWWAHYPLGGSEWDLESVRPSKPFWKATVAAHKCNW